MRKTTNLSTLESPSTMATGGRDLDPTVECTASAEEPEYSCRVRTLTEKGSHYAKQLLTSLYSRSWKSLEKSMNTITHLLKVSDVCVVENERQRFDELLAEYEDVNTKYRASLTTEELKYHEAEFHMSDKVIASFKTELYSWLHANKQSDRAQSVISGKTRSSSGKSSKHSSASESKMQQLAKLAALEVSKRFVEKEVQLERCRFESEQKTKELELDKQMAIARAELAVYEQFDVDESCKQQNDSVVLGDTQLYAGRYTTPILPPFDVLHPAADDKSSRPQPSYSLQPAWSSSSPVVSGQQSTSNTQSFRSAAATTSLTSAAGTVQGQEVRPPIIHLYSQPEQKNRERNSKRLS